MSVLDDISLGGDILDNVSDFLKSHDEKMKAMAKQEDDLDLLLGTTEFSDKIKELIAGGIQLAYNSNESGLNINSNTEVSSGNIAEQIGDKISEATSPLQKVAENMPNMQSEAEMDTEVSPAKQGIDTSIAENQEQLEKERRREEIWNKAKEIVSNPFLQYGLNTTVDILRNVENDINSNDARVSDLRNDINKTLISSGNPYAAAAGVANAAIAATGGAVDASQGLGEGKDLANAAISLLVPGAGYFTKDLSDKKVDVSDALKGSSSYAGTVNNINAANQNAGKILIGQGLASYKLDDANRQAEVSNEIIQDGKDRLNSATNMSTANEVYYKLNGSLTNGIQYGEDGIKVDKQDDARLIKSETTDKNVIPDGAKHVNRHKLETKKNTEYFVDNVTKKGIPVFHCDDETGEVIQDCEIEKEEIIFTKELTDLIEESRKIGTTQAALELGKRMVYEIFHNTIDNVGMLKNKKS